MIAIQKKNAAKLRHYSSLKLFTVYKQAFSAFQARFPFNEVAEKWIN
jgi:hypothetical protein